MCTYKKNIDYLYFSSGNEWNRSESQCALCFKIGEETHDLEIIVHNYIATLSRRYYLHVE